MTGAGDELAELLWDHHGPALLLPRPPPFQPFTCSAAGSSRSHELKRHAFDSTKAPAFVSVPLGMHDAGAGLGLAGLPVHDDGDAVPWLHCPVVDDGADADTAPLPPEYCAGLLSEYSDAAASHAAAVVVPAAANNNNKLAPPSAGGAGEGVVNFTFFSRPLQRPHAAATASNRVESSTVVEAAARPTTNRLRSTPLFSDQRMAWLQPPPKAPAPRTSAAPPPPPPLAPPPLPPHSRHGETETAPHPRPPQPEAPPPDAAAVTTSSVCSGNGDHRSQLKRSTHHLDEDFSVSPDEDLDLDDEPGGGARRSAARSSAKRSRTAEVHNLSERRRRDRINEKMRALQELIPNCNKVDKASMLEEAIEYLKTLQLQVQMMMMSMGGATGLCMPMTPPAAAMLLPAAMHHHYPMAHAHFPHQLGMGLGFGMAAATAIPAGFDMLPRVAHPFPCGPPLAMPPPPGAMFGVPAQAMMPAVPAAFAAHMASAVAPAAQTEAAAGGAAAAAAPAPPGGEAEQHPPPARGVAQGDDAEVQRPERT